MPGPLVSVALPLPLQSQFTYSVPGGVSPPPRGARVVVPFGRRRVVGLVTGQPATVPEAAVREIEEVMDDEAVVPERLLDLAEWVSAHYLAPPGECYRLVMPPAGVRASRALIRLAAAASPDSEPVLRALADGPLSLGALTRRLGRDPSSQIARLRREGHIVVQQELRTSGFRELQVAVLAQPDAAPRGSAQQEVVTRLRGMGGRSRIADLVAARPSLRGAVKRLAELGVVTLESERDLRRPEVMEGGESGRPEPTGDQSRVLESLIPRVDASRFHPVLLHGITGSGKTEVYFRAAERALELRLGVLVLAPEIGLTPMLVRAATARFGETVAVLHSELSAGERHDQWWRIRDGVCRVVVGARSAVFAPIDRLGLVVVDEEHDGAYKQDESPRYHGRDTAVMRAKLEGAPIVLGSATPGLESYSNAQAGRYELLCLPTRIGSQGLARVEIVDRRAVLRETGVEAILTPALHDALALRLERREQALLLLNRRGFATSLLCRECGEQVNCPNCSVTLTLHQAGRLADCHYCGYRARTRESCEACRGEYLRLTGYGTERVVDAVRAALPEARVERLDRDVSSRRGALARVLRRFEAREVDILVGTQMIAKGHDFPGVTLVGVIDADVGLGLPDFRSAERTFQLLTQVAGRAGRADLPGEVILQSHFPDHYALETACAQDYEAFFEREMEFRNTMGYPPTLALVNTVVRSRDADEAAGAAADIAHRLREAARGRFWILGPARAPLARLRGFHRHQVLMKGPRPAMREVLGGALRDRYGPTRWPGVVVDVDPVTIL